MCGITLTEPLAARSAGNQVYQRAIGGLCNPLWARTLGQRSRTCPGRTLGWVRNTPDYRRQDKRRNLPTLAIPAFAAGGYFAYGVRVAMGGSSG